MTPAPPTGSATATTPAAVAALRSTATIRERAHWLTARARAGDSAHFTVHDDRIAVAAADVATLTRTRFPDLAVPYHSRWRHFEAGGVDRKATLERLLGDADAADRARAMIDLTVISVLLDAGAGPDWHYREPGSGATFARSEGLGVASFYAFTTGLFSSAAATPLQADADGLRRLDADALATAFGVDATNPMVGLAGRVEVLRRLGDAMTARPDVFGTPARPGGLYDALAGAGQVTAHAILTALLDALSPIWPSRNAVDGVPLGDCWHHAAVPGAHGTAGWVPFHKLSQWLTYSLLEPFAWAGVTVDGLDELTGLPEYRNGGLLLDTGVLALRDPTAAQRTWTPADELVVEWRALTVALLDDLADAVRADLGVPVPLACVLEGGTWAAGRATAQRLRGGLPPLAIDSDGTVF